ncbi:hypothetical protein G9A89_013210 [Geosiphon pyriformis]|nr:hypothetical protein G9A89_013210 [Geosiphon pyriformis]
MDMVTSNQLGKIINAQFEELQTQITQVILENKIQKILQEGELHDQSEVGIVNMEFQDSSQELQDSRNFRIFNEGLQNSKIPGFLSTESQDSRNSRIPVMKNRGIKESQLYTSTIDTIESLFIIQRTQPKPSDTKPSDQYQLQLALSTKLQSEIFWSMFIFDESHSLPSANDCSKEICLEAVSTLDDKKKAACAIVDFVKRVAELYCSRLWLTRAKHRMDIEWAGLIGDAGLISGLSCCMSSALSDEMVRMLGIIESFVYANSKSFVLDYEATVGSSIVVLNKSIMELSFNIGVKSAEFRKKRRGGALEDNIDSRKFAAAKVSIDIEEECLVEETSFNHGDGEAFAEEDSEQIPKSSKILTKRALGKPLGKINFLGDDIDNILLDKLVVFPLPLKNLVNVSVRKSFTLDISLDNIVGKSAQEKLVVAVVLKKIPIGISTKAVRTALSEFGIIKSIKIQLVELWQKAVVEFKQIKHADLVAACWFILIKKDVMHDVHDVYKALLYTLPMGTNAHNIWNYVASVSEKTCVINYYPIFYAQTRCATVCFNSAESLDAVIETTSVLKGANLYWSHLVLAKCAGCEKLGHTSLACPVGGKKSVFSGALLRKTFSDLDKNRLAAIYAKRSASVACLISFGGVS